ncbi:MAG: sulfite exporter TauE/SafE family protein [Rhodopila sp.]|nr:sulfite exporter TauE/SafE family protein [Rhodopila sp.]
MGLFSAVSPMFMLSGFIVGLLVGQTGMGGGSLMTPILVLIFGIHPATAVGTDLLYASATKGVGTLVHGLNHTINWRITRRLASGSVPSTVITLLVISHYNITGATSGRIISLLLGIMLLLTALSLIFRQRFLALVGPALERITNKQAARLTVATGVSLGVLVTLSSVGAGALGVTALLILYPRVPMAVIVGSDIAHAVPLTLVAGIGHWWLGSVDWPLLMSLLSGSIPGIVLGSYLSAHVPDAVLRPILAATLCVVGGRLVL